MSKKHYAERDSRALGKFYMDHLMAMTAERLHSKSDIAAELAHRDRTIQFLLEALQGIEEYWNRDSNESAMLDALEHAMSAARIAITEVEGPIS